MAFLLTDFLGVFLGIATVLIFFETVWVFKKVNRYLTAVVILSIAVANVILSALLLNTAILLPLSVLLIFALSFYYVSGITAKLLYSLLAAATLFASEILTAVIFVSILGIPIELVQDNVFQYFIGTVMSNLLALLIVFVIRIAMKQYRKEENNQFSLIMVLIPLQSVIICFVVYSYSIDETGLHDVLLGIISIIISISVIFVALFVVTHLQKSIGYKRDLDVAEIRLKTQIEQYQKILGAQKEVRKIRHDINNDLIAISGILEDGQSEEALKRINAITLSLAKSASVVSTGIPALDAVVNAKIGKAERSEIHIIYTIKINNELNIDGFDLAGIVASALDNAIEGILRSHDVKRNIHLSIMEFPDFISIVIENYASGSIHEKFRTSKSDRKNHGFGLVQMKDIADKYDGDVQPHYDPVSGKFSLKVLLKNS